MARLRPNAGQSVQGFNKRLQDDLESIFKALDQLPKEFSLTIRRNIAKKAVAPFINQAILNAPRKTGNLKLSIDTKTFRNNPQYIFAGVILKKKIRVGGSVGTEQIDAFYAKFIEYGYTQVAWPRKGGTIRKGSFLASQQKVIPPRPFLRPAWDTTKSRCADEMEKQVEKRLKKYMKKVQKT